MHGGWRDAHLVNGDRIEEATRVQLAEQLLHLLLGEALGREVEQLGLGIVALEVGHDARTHRAVDVGRVLGGHDAALIAVGALVLCKGKEWSDDYRDPRTRRGRKLKAERFAVAGAQADKGVAAGEDRFNCLALRGTECD